MTKRLLKALGLTIIVLLVASAVVMAQQTNDPEVVNTLRVYGRDGLTANFPYETYLGPFDLTSPEAPPMDFVVWNPAYMYHLDENANNRYGRFFDDISVNGLNANQKVHLRQWYTPVYTEPTGLNWVQGYSWLEGGGAAPTADIVMEYTYILLGAQTNDPIFGLPGRTSFVFPLAGNGEQVGLDDYDINNDGQANITRLETLGVATTQTLQSLAGGSFPLDQPSRLHGSRWMDISTGPMTVRPGDVIYYLDHRIEIKSVVPSFAANPGVTVDVNYAGEREWDIVRNRLATNRIVPYQSTLSAGRHELEVEGLTNSPYNPPSRSAEFIAGDSHLSLLDAPFYLQVRDVGTLNATVVFGRLIVEGESFYVDGAEYAIAKIFSPELQDADAVVQGAVPQTNEFLGISTTTLDEPDVFTVTVPNVDGTFFADDCEVVAHGGTVSETNPATGVITVTGFCCNEPVYVDYCYLSDSFKYVTVRNPMPKEERVWLNPLSVWKEGVWPNEPLPMLPPFNMDHDIIDDVNIPETTEVPDAQYPDNPATNDIASAYNTIADRRLYGDETQPPAVVYYVEQTKEWRFDTNLLEEKFTLATGQNWQWINIETHPWNYTEFVLPEIDDKPTEEGFTYGDYILVSSFITEDSTDTWTTWQETGWEWDSNSDSVRVKFFFDAEEGLVNSADVYVNDAAYNEKFDRMGGREPANSLRIYGRGSANAPTTYDHTTMYEGPLALTGREAPPKDFLQFNPAYHSEEEGVVVNGKDANQKVHLRQWYVPEYGEPAGKVWTPQDVVTRAAIVKEYTYILLDNDNNPTLADPARRNLFFFPVADWTDQIGLDSYDWDGDGEPNRVRLEAADGNHVNLSTGVIGVEEGDVIRFLDYQLTVLMVDSQHPGPRVQVGIKYSGNRTDVTVQPQTTNIVHQGQTASASRHFFRIAGPQGVYWPWYVEVVSVLGDSTANIKVGRILQLGESFFVDGAEYLVSGIYFKPGADGGLKYITLRNSLPKDLDVNLESLSVIKKAVHPFEDLPFLPPFNQVHTMVDDTHIPKALTETGPCSGGPDDQFADNPAEECIDPAFNTIAKRLIPDVCPIVEYYIEQDKEPRFDTNLLEEKFLELELIEESESDTFSDIDFSGEPVSATVQVLTENFDKANEAFFCAAEGSVETTHPTVTVGSYDQTTGAVVVTATNTGSYTFTLTYCYYSGYLDQRWQWINIATQPWNYTEFVLPERPNKPAELGMALPGLGDWYGDYILVSSWMTENSANVWYAEATDAVRMKFVYDAAYGKGIYVNQYLDTADFDRCDINRDGVVDLRDVIFLLERWGWEDTDAGWDPWWDIVPDGRINIMDLIHVLDCVVE